MIAAGGHRKVGAQTKFMACRIVEYERPRTDVFTGPCEEDVGRLDNVGCDMFKACAFEHRHDGSVLFGEGFAFA
jgi:hypothetical protein